jgi:phosphohistidine phosphatase
VPLVRRLVLVRHAKADPADRGGPGDHARPLTGRGRRQAAATGALLDAAGLGAVDLVLVSSAERARQTWAGMAGAVRAGAVAVEDGLYETSAPALVHRLAAAGDDVRSLVVVGHEPVVSAAAAALAGEGSDGPALARVRAGAATGSASVLELAGAWGDLALGRCRLVAHLVP